MSTKIVKGVYLHELNVGHFSSFDISLVLLSRASKARLSVDIGDLIRLDCDSAEWLFVDLFRKSDSARASLLARAVVLAVAYLFPAHVIEATESPLKVTDLAWCCTSLAHLELLDGVVPGRVGL